MLSVVGLGPAGPEHLSTATRSAIEGAEQVFLRTVHHPAADAVMALRPDAETFDGLYENATHFPEVYDAIVAELQAAASVRRVCYAVPGSPVVAERTVELLRAAAREGAVELTVLPAISYLDLAWDRLALDPVIAQVCLVDAADFAVAAARTGPLLVSQTWSKAVLSEMKLSVEEPGAGDVAVLLHHLGLPDEVVVTVPWTELDRTLDPDHLTAVFVPPMARPPGAAVVELDGVVARLRLECPWDREQSHRSLLRHLIEETYEAIEAIEGLGDEPSSAEPELVSHAEEELGDLLGQVVFHSRLATEEGLFTLSDVARTLTEKLVVRHPHVFGAASASTAAAVVDNWERSKDLGKKRSHLFEGIPRTLPALATAEKAERKLRSVGLGWNRTGVGDGEMAERLARVLSDAVAEEAGELLLLVARQLAAAGVDPEAALRGALARLSDELRAVEEEAASEGLRLVQWVEQGHDVRRLHQPLC